MVNISIVVKCNFVNLCLLDNFIKEQLHQYNIGKRHLANMMGKDPEFFTQHDVDVIFFIIMSFKILTFMILIFILLYI